MEAGRRQIKLSELDEAWQQGSFKALEYVMRAADRTREILEEELPGKLLEVLADGAVAEAKSSEARGFTFHDEDDPLEQPTPAPTGTLELEDEYDLAYLDREPPLDRAAQSAGAIERAEETRRKLGRDPFDVQFWATNPASTAWALERSSTEIVKIDAGTRRAVREIMRDAFQEGRSSRTLARIRKEVNLTAYQRNLVRRLEDRLRDPNNYGKTVTAWNKKLHWRVPVNGPNQNLVDRATSRYYDRIHRARARNIARTETVAAANEGQREQWVQQQQEGLLPQNVARVWIVTPDDRLCRICSRMAGQIRGLDENFNTNTPQFGNVPGPPAHPQCRCATGLTRADGSYSPGRIDQRRADNLILDRPSSYYGRPRIDGSGTPINTADMHRLADGSYSRERQELHNAIIREAMRGKTPVQNPQATILGGGPASGKSSVMAQAGVSRNTVVINVDDIRVILPEYGEAIRDGLRKVARYTHDEASYIGKLLQRRASDGGFNILLDGTGDNSLAKLTGKITQFRDKGYRVVGQYVTLDTDEAVRRMLIRAAKPPHYRDVPEELMRGIHSKVSEVLPEAMRGGLFDEVYLYDNNVERGVDAIRIAQANRKGELTILDDELYRNFLKKSPNRITPSDNGFWEPAGGWKSENVDDAVEQIREEALERAAQWDSGGNMIGGYTSDAKGSVTLPPKAYQSGGRFVHNHPSGTPFSGDDLNIATMLRLREMRAVGTLRGAPVDYITRNLNDVVDKAIAKLAKFQGDELTKAETIKLATHLGGEIRDHYEHLIGVIQGEIVKKWPGLLSYNADPQLVTYASTLHRHMALKRLAKEYGFKYETRWVGTHPATGQKATLDELLKLEGLE